VHLIRARPPLMGAAFSGQTAGTKTMIPIHSPAPWSIDFDRINDATGKQVARITPRLTGEHNHTLIAAAPELLAALEGALVAVRYLDDHEGAEELMNQVCKAIIKAKGGVR
jgi:hypothetical protein